jgi:serine O-acetyltransferase
LYVNALTLYYAGRALRRARVPLLPRICEALVYLLFNCSIPLSAEIGPGCRCGHRGMSVVIHPKAQIGPRCLIRPQVVIGGGGRGDQDSVAPIIGDGVEFGVGAKVLGGVRIGDGAVIGANAVVLDDVPARAVAVGVPAKIVRGANLTADDAR